jgi:uncharacterized membrane protein YqaE (UPF0057 family)
LTLNATGALQVIIARDRFDNYFWLNLLLTLLAWLPGALHAVWVVVEHTRDLADEPLTRPKEYDPLL